MKNINTISMHVEKFYQLHTETTTAVAYCIILQACLTSAVFFKTNLFVKSFRKTTRVLKDMYKKYFRLQPLLTEIKHDRKTVAMGMLDYIRGNNMEYHFRRGDPPRYGFDWRLVFFETTIPESKRGKSPQDTKP